MDDSLPGMEFIFLYKSICYFKLYFFPALCEIIHGLGERLPRRDTVALIESVLLKQMILLVYRLQKAAILQNNQYISVKHLLYVLKDHKVTIIRILSYYCKNNNYVYIIRYILFK